MTERIKKTRAQSGKEYYSKNKEKIKAYKLGWERDNKEKIIRYRSITLSERAKRRRYWIYKYKVAKGCCLCGYNEHRSALDFDHLDPKLKSRMICKMFKQNLKTLIAEIRKCQILCANCHRIKTQDPEYFERLVNENRS